MDNKTIIVFCNKNDFFLTRICIASIRYYYPKVDIFLVKDNLRGAFSTEELCVAFNVKVLDLGIEKYGWGTGKVHLMLSNEFPGQKVLLLDSDIVFAGKVLDDLYKNSMDSDFSVNADYYDDPYHRFIKGTYYDYKYINEIDPDFKFPGYCFNTGQMLVTTGIVNKEELFPYLDLEIYPYWKRLDKMPMVDHSMLNYILPKKEQAGEIKISKLNFMKWSEGPEAKEMLLEDVIAGTQNCLIHWAGALRIPYISKMTRADILKFLKVIIISMYRLEDGKRK